MRNTGDGLLGCGDEVRVSRVWERGEGRTSGMTSEVCMDKGVCKNQTS